MALLSNPAEGRSMKNLVQAALLPAEMHPDRIGERITALRSCLKLSKADFADSIRLDRSTLTKVEAGKKGLDIAVGARIADLYGFGLDFIYRGSLSDVPDIHRPYILAEVHAAKAARLEANDSP